MASASNPSDPLQTLRAALTAEANSKEQADILAALRESLELRPAPITVLAEVLIRFVVDGGDSLLKTWVLDLLQFALCRAQLTLEQRTQLASQTLDTLAQLLDDRNPLVVKVVVSCLTAIYPLLFRSLCANTTNSVPWNTLLSCKARVIDLVWNPTTVTGVRLSALKFVQRVILVQTRGVSDPRLQNKSDPNISMCPPGHPFIFASKLETEGQQLLEGVVGLLYSSDNPDALTAVFNSWSNLCKLRPNLLLSHVIPALLEWTPQSSSIRGSSLSAIRSVEKALRCFLNFARNFAPSQDVTSRIHDIMSRQAARLSEQKLAGRKRPNPVSAEPPSDVKRMKTESDAVSATFLAGFDFTTLPAALITNLIVANIEAFSEADLMELVQSFRRSRGIADAPQPVASTSKSVPPSADVAPRTSTPETHPSTLAPVVVKDEPIDPLKMDIDEDELEYEPDKLNDELGDDDSKLTGLGSDSKGLALASHLNPSSFQLPPPKDPSSTERTALIDTALTRICEAPLDMGEALPPDSQQAGGHSPSEMWMLLVIRLVTRPVNPPLEDEESADQAASVVSLTVSQDRLRQKLCDYIMTDFPARIRLATAWMNEEWYNDRIQSQADPDWRPNYDTWLSRIVASYQTRLDKTFSRFLLDLPTVPEDVLDLLRELCGDGTSLEKMQVGFVTLRGLVTQRPSMRDDALQILLELTTHPDKKIRGAAINTVKIWVPNVQPMDGRVRLFARQVLRKLRSVTPAEGDTQDERMEDGRLAGEGLVETPYLPERIELPARESQVLQHLELLFALSVKVPELLDEIFTEYCRMDVTVQQAVQKLSTPLIRSLGSSHGKLLTLLRTFPPGAESLALRVLNIFTESGRPSAQLVALVKGLIQDRDLDAHFLVPIIGEMDKADIIKHLPKIVSILNGEAESKTLVRSVFSSIVVAPPQSFASVTSNLPRLRSSELLGPAELMVLLHDSEKEIGLQVAKEAISVCFSMTEIFRSDVLAVVMQQIVDEPVIPVLFLRTARPFSGAPTTADHIWQVIQAVTTYKSLVPFVSTTLFSRLITKKIWTNPRLWEGFIWCAKVIAPASFGALLHLPKDQLRELVDKQPNLKSGLRNFVTKKSANKAKVADILKILGEPVDLEPTTTETVEVPQSAA
ncbi:unnamed protein product [Mycena citricolor]|uniref:Symplekin n=1 Tax=Mycena citricolor TaxID=2018698 RepID=A0AAD2HC53_9AGAR|nr:unnamed protein product [Mycena citricolor]